MQADNTNPSLESELNALPKLSTEEIGELHSFISGFNSENPFYLSHTHTLLFNLAKQLGSTGKYAEIGSRTGNSALTVKYANADRDIFCYDLPGGGWGGVPGSEAIFNKNLSGFTKVNYFTGNSQSDRIKELVAQNGPYDLFLVDGDHSDEGAYGDLCTAFASLKRGGLLVFDDTIHHEYLKGTFLRFCYDKGVREYILIDSLSPAEEAKSILLRGIGILKKN